MQAHIKDTSTLDKIRSVFKDSLTKFSHDVNSYRGKYNGINSDATSKINQIKNKIWDLESQVRNCESRIRTLSAQREEQLSSARYHSTAASTCEYPDQRNYHSRQAAECNRRANELAQQVSFESNKLYELQNELSKEQGRLSLAEDIKRKIEFTLEEYNSLTKQISYNSDDIFEQTSKKVEQIKNSINEYGNIKSNTNTSTAKEKMTQAPSVAKSAKVEDVIEEKSYFKSGDFEYLNSIAVVNTEQKKKRINTSIEYNNSHISFSALIKSNNINITSTKGDVNKDTISCMVDYLTEELRRNDIKSLNIFIDKKEKNIYENFGFEVLEVYEDGIEMKKNI